MPASITRAAIDAAIARARSDGAPPQSELVDDREPGLRLRIGRRTARWSLIVRVKTGERIRVNLGSWPHMGISDARQAARAKRTVVDDGKNPNQVKRAEIAAVVEEMRQRVPLADVLDIYDGDVLAHLKTGKATRQQLDGPSGILRPFLRKGIKEISRAELSDAVKKLAKTAPQSANRKLAYVSAFFNWALREEYVEINPARNIRKPSPEKVRDRFHTLDELREIWAATIKMGYPFSQLYRLLIALPMRREEVAGMPLADITLGEDEPGDQGVWLLTSDRTKISNALRVPLSPLARSIIIEAIEHEDRPANSKIVFTTTGDTTISGFSKAKRRLDATIDDARRAAAREAGRPFDDEDAMPRWVVHDLRTTFNTHGCEILDIAPHIADRILNHVATATRSKIMRVYNKSELFEQRRTALNAWAALLEERVIGSKVAEVSSPT